MYGVVGARSRPVEPKTPPNNFIKLPRLPPRRGATNGLVMYIRNDVLYRDTRPSFCGRFKYSYCHRVAELAIKPPCIESTTI